MKRSLFRAIIKKYKALLIAMLFVSSLGCGIMIGMANGILSLKTNLDDYIEETQYPDAVVETKVMTRDILEEIRAVPGVEKADARLTGTLLLLAIDGYYYTMQAMTYSEDEFQGIHYWEKSEAESENPILLEHRFAKMNDIHVGDPVVISLDDRSWDCTVDGIISRPEMLAFHKLGDVQMLSTDIGYVYIPIELLGKIIDPDYEAASAEWKDNNEKYLKQKKEAEEEYEKITGEISDAEKLLEEKKAELNKQLKTAKTKKAELLEYKKEIEKKSEELKEKEAELLEKKAQLEQAEAELKKAEEEITAGKAELSAKKQELDSTKETLEANRTEIQSQLAELDKKEEELQQTKAELEKAKAEIEKKLQELDEKEKELNDTKAEALEQLGLINELKDAIQSLKGLIDTTLVELIKMAEEAVDLQEWASYAAEQLAQISSEADRIANVLDRLIDQVGIEKLLESMGLSSEQINSEIAELYAFSGRLQNYTAELVRLIKEGAPLEEIDAVRKTLIQDCLEEWEHFNTEYHLSDLDYNTLMGKIDAVIKEIGDGLSQIEEGLTQIAEGRKLLLEKQEEAEGGLSRIAEGEQQLQGGREALSEGLTKIEEGLAAVAAGYEEIDRYEKQIQDAENKARVGRAELDGYTNEYLDAQKALAEAKDALVKALKEVESGIREIDDKVAEGRKKLKEGEDELQRNKDASEEQWLDFIKRSKDVESELKEAKEKLDEWNGYGEFCNQFLMLFAEDADPDNTLAEVEKVLGTENIKSSVTYEDSEVKHKIDHNVIPLETMTLLVPMMFFAVALIVGFLFMSFLIRQSRREIGILRAVGFSGNRIVALFSSINAVFCIGSVILGIIMGHIVARFINGFFQEYFDLYYYNYAIHWTYIWVAIVLTIIVGQIATICSTRYISHIHPTEAMSRPAPAAFSNGRKLFSSLNVSPFFKYCVSSLLRNKLRLLFSIICMASSVMIIFSAFSFDFSKNRIVSEQFEDRIKYGCEIFFVAEPDEGFMERLAASGLARDAEEVYYFAGEIEGNGVTEKVTVKGIEPDSELIGIHDEGRNRIYVSDEGIILEKHTADPLNVSEGDMVMVNGVPMRITAINEEYQIRSQYIPVDTARELGSPDMYSVICNVTKENETPLIEFLTQEENYIYTAFTYRVYAGIEDGFNLFGICVWVLLAFAVVIGSVIVINTICFNLQEQKKDLCILRTLGFQHSDISFRMMSQAAVYYVFSCIIGIPSGIVVTKLFLKKLEVETRSYPFVNDIRVYLYTLLLVLGYIVLSHFISMRTIKKWNLVETVKDKE